MAKAKAGLSRIKEPHKMKLLQNLKVKENILLCSINGEKDVFLSEKRSFLNRHDHHH